MVTDNSVRSGCDTVCMFMIMS